MMMYETFAARKRKQDEFAKLLQTSKKRQLVLTLFPTNTARPLFSLGLVCKKDRVIYVLSSQRGSVEFRFREVLKRLQKIYELSMLNTVQMAVVLSFKGFNLDEQK